MPYTVDKTSHFLLLLVLNILRSKYLLYIEFTKLEVEILVTLTK